MTDRLGRRTSGPPISAFARRLGAWLVTVAALCGAPGPGFGSTYDAISVVRVEQLEVSADLVRWSPKERAAQRLEALRRTLTDPRNLEAVVERYDLGSAIGAGGGVIEALARRVRVDLVDVRVGGTGEPASSIEFSVAVQHPDPEHARRIANALAHAYVTGGLTGESGVAGAAAATTGGEPGALASQAKPELVRLIERLARRTADLQARVDTAGEEQGTNEARIAELRAERARIADELSRPAPARSGAEESPVERLRRELAGARAMGPPADDREVRRLEAALAAATAAQAVPNLEREAAAIEARYAASRAAAGSDGAPADGLLAELAAARERLAHARMRAAGAPATDGRRAPPDLRVGLRRSLVEVDRSIERLTARNAELEQTLAPLREQLAAARAEEERHRSLLASETVPDGATAPTAGLSRETAGERYVLVQPAAVAQATTIPSPWIVPAAAGVVGLVVLVVLGRGIARLRRRRRLPGGAHEPGTMVFRNVGAALPRAPGERRAGSTADADRPPRSESEPETAAATVTRTVPEGTAAPDTISQASGGGVGTEAAGAVRTAREPAAGAAETVLASTARGAHPVQDSAAGYPEALPEAPAGAGTTGPRTAAGTEPETIGEAGTPMPAAGASVSALRPVRSSEVPAGAGGLGAPLAAAATMYEAHFGLREKPFSLLPDPAFLYMSRQHTLSFAVLQYGLTSNAGLTVLSGEIGCGKTTLLRHLLNQIEDDITVGLLTNTHPSFRELLQWICAAYGLEYEGKGKVALHQAFVEFMIAEYARGRRTVLVIDEAQNMSAATLEELRMLSNVNVDDHLLLQLILVGQPQLRDTLARPDLVQVAQRIAADYSLGGFEEHETRDYIAHRLGKVGGDPAVFEPGTHEIIHRYSKGIPRVINVVCDTALVYAYGGNQARVSAETVQEVIRDRDRTHAPTGHEPELDAVYPLTGADALARAPRPRARALRRSVVRPAPMRPASEGSPLIDEYLDVPDLSADEARELFSKLRDES